MYCSISMFYSLIYKQVNSPTLIQLTLYNRVYKVTSVQCVLLYSTVQYSVQYNTSCVNYIKFYVDDI